MRCLQSVAQMVALALLLVGGLLMSSCKSSRWSKADQDTDRQAAGVVVQPKRVSADASPMSSPVFFEVDEKTGRAKQSLVLRLDYFPEAATGGGANLPACYGAFAPEFELGVFHCEGREDLLRALTVGHVSQDCYTNPRFHRVPARVSFDLRDCRRGVLKLHAFDPQLRVDVEQAEAM